jgi:alkylhydroperoxidase/carboxymuconolactone decarboxylase family protein YurZ
MEKAAIKLGATMEEIMEVLKVCVVQGVHACNLGLPIIIEELDRFQCRTNSPENGHKVKG